MYGVQGLYILYFNELKKLESRKLEIKLSRIPIIPIHKLHKYKPTIKIHYLQILYYTNYDFQNYFNIYDIGWFIHFMAQ